MSDDEVLTGSGPRSNYATGDNLAKRQSIFAHLDPETSSGGSPIDRAPWNPAEVVADVGCGNGLWLASAATRAGRAVGLDLSVGMLRAARSAAGPDAPLVQADAHRLPLATGSVDGLMAMHMLYHLADIDAALEEVARVLRPGGWMLATTNSGVPTGAAVLYQEAVERVVGRRFEHLLPPFDFDGEHGGAILGPHFAAVVTAVHVAGFKVTDPDALVGPLQSVAEPIEATIAVRPDWAAVYNEVRGLAGAEIARAGAFRYEQRVHSFLCRT